MFKNTPKGFNSQVINFSGINPFTDHHLKGCIKVQKSKNIIIQEEVLAELHLQRVRINFL